MSESKSTIAEKWDHSLEKGIKRMAYGGVASGIVAALLFRGVGFRSLVLGIGLGTGLGMTYAETRRDFERLSPAEVPNAAQA